MKDQYFGDVNDYRKYGLLRILDREDLAIGIVWMLTPDDGSSDGGKRGYLRQPLRWRRHDPALFDFLQARSEQRTIGALRGGPLAYEEEAAMVPRDPAARSALLDATADRFRKAGVELVYFDSDNGLAVGSVAPSSPGYEKYLEPAEARAFLAKGFSVMVYQHFPRTPHLPFLRRLVYRLADETPIEEAWSFVTPDQAFVALPHGRHAEAIRRGASEVSRTWHARISVLRHKASEGWVPRAAFVRSLSEGFK